MGAIYAAGGPRFELARAEPGTWDDELPFGQFERKFPGQRAGLAQTQGALIKSIFLMQYTLNPINPRFKRPAGRVLVFAF